MMEAATSAQPSSPPAKTNAASKPPMTNSSTSAMNELRMPRVIQERTDQMAERISEVDISKINQFLRIANLACASVLGIAAFIALTRLQNYQQFLIYSALIFLSAALVLVENHEMFPRFATLVKRNFNFIFTAFGRAIYLLIVAMLAFCLGWFGLIMGILFVGLSLFNFFLIYKHPAYQAHMTNMETPADNTSTVSEVRYNPSQQSATASNNGGHIMV